MSLIVESKFRFLKDFNKVLNIKFYENPPSGIRIVAGRQTVIDDNPSISQIQVHSVTAMLIIFRHFVGKRNNIRTIQNILV